MLERLWFVGIAKRGSKKSEPAPSSHRFSVVAMYSTNSVLLQVFVETLSDAVAVLLKEPRFLLMRAELLSMRSVVVARRSVPRKARVCRATLR